MLTETEPRVLYYEKLHSLLATATPDGISKVRVNDMLHGPTLGIDLQVFDEPSFPSMQDRLYSRTALSTLVPLPIMDTEGINFVGERVEANQMRMMRSCKL